MCCCQNERGGIPNRHRLANDTICVELHVIGTSVVFGAVDLLTLPISLSAWRQQEHRLKLTILDTIVAILSGSGMSLVIAVGQRTCLG